MTVDNKFVICVNMSSYVVLLEYYRDTMGSDTIYENKKESPIQFNYIAEGGKNNDEETE